MANKIRGAIEWLRYYLLPIYCSHIFNRQNQFAVIATIILDTFLSIGEAIDLETAELKVVVGITPFGTVPDD